MVVDISSTLSCLVCVRFDAAAACLAYGDSYTYDRVTWRATLGVVGETGRDSSNGAFVCICWPPIYMCVRSNNVRKPVFDDRAPSVPCGK